ncbi:hypothetical protein [Haladaptatus sp. GCM10025893]|uniref:hypothetical protein n=1 Tax=Haladaptatus sp. GCM10025893 TaxID=3252659 RepID=UPI00360618FD
MLLAGRGGHVLATSTIPAERVEFVDRLLVLHDMLDALEGGPQRSRFGGSSRSW